MKKIGFIGAYEKTNLMLYIAKLLTVAGKKVLIVDSTTIQRARYIVPCMTPSIYYVTEFEGFDVAVGFNTTLSIAQYLGIQDLKYDYVLIDIDSNEAFNSFEMDKADKNYFVTAFDNYSLKKGMEIIGKMQDKIRMTKILFSRDMLEEENDYLDFLSFYFSIVWNEEKLYFPYEQGDNTVHIENQRSAAVRFKELSQQYKEAVIEIVQEIAHEVKIKELIKHMKAN
jgi:hypothetical protein